MDNSLRPGTKETLEGLINSGHKMYIWSGVGLRTEVVKRHGLDYLISGIYHKPLYDYHQRLDELGVPLVPDFVVDDYPEIVLAFGGMWIPPYYFGNANDREMERVYRVASQYAKDGTSDDPYFRAKGVIA